MTITKNRNLLFYCFIRQQAGLQQVVCNQMNLYGNLLSGAAHIDDMNLICVLIRTGH